MRPPALPAIAATLLLTCGACAHAGRGGRAVPIDARPTPPQPEVVPGSEPGADEPSPPRAVTPGDTPRAAESRIAADTLAANAAIRRCAGRRLLAEQESTVEAASRLLQDVRTAIAEGDLSRAESRAREARQLTRSLVCR